MSRELASLSRRALLRFASLSPFAFLGFGSDSRAQNSVCGWVKAACLQANIQDSEEVVSITDRLWGKFMDGAGGKGVKPEAVDKIIELSGGHVICNLATLRSDPTALQDVLNKTDRCCYRCGELAADHAGWFFNISVKDVENAWCETRDEVRADCIKAAKLAGKTQAQAEAYCQEPSRAGLGC